MIREQPTDETTPFDFDAMLARCLGKEELVNRALFRFQSVVESDLEELDHAIAGSDGTKIASIAHRIKGASSNVSALRVQAQAAKLEQLALTQKLEDTPSCRQRLKDEVSLFSEYTSARRQMTSAPSGQAV